MTIREQIVAALSRTVCGGWDRGFLESILDQVEKDRELSVKQKATLLKVLERNDEVNQAVHDNWSTEYIERYKNEAIVLANYHSMQPYYKAMASDILNDHIPERKKFLRMYNNKYSKKVLTEHSKVAKYLVGDFVSPRSAFVGYKHAQINPSIAWVSARKSVERFEKMGGFIIEIKKEILTHAKGAKRYRILPIGETIPLIVEERFIKLNRHKNNS